MESRQPENPRQVKLADVVASGIEVRSRQPEKSTTESRNLVPAYYAQERFRGVETTEILTELKPGSMRRPGGRSAGSGNSQKIDG